MIEWLGSLLRAQIPAGVVASLIAAIIVGVVVVSSRRAKFVLRRVFGRQKRLSQLMRRIRAAGFESMHPTMRGARYYYRQEDRVNESKRPFYLFFTQEDLVLEEFKALMIPPLDLGHGLAEEESQNQLLGTRFGSDWFSYLTGIARLARGARESKLTWTDGFFLGRTRPFRAQRIVLIDKRVLDLFVFETDWVYASRSGDSPLLREVAQGIIDYSTTVHEICSIGEPYKNDIETTYVDKQLVASDEYYDFGFYRINGVPVVYNPIYEKRRGKRIVREKVLVGTSKRQLFGIREYEKDFELIWGRAATDFARQSAALSVDRFRDGYFTRRESKYFTDFSSYSHDFFCRGYFELLRAILEKHGSDDEPVVRAASRDFDS